ncbi:MAG: PorP/SprF family type IX secretion system membrane protein [Bacteroidales bacterium]|nr:PorP/SprF family type IX secretion system membrane protein [Bacteroidales bacterium]
MQQLLKLKYCILPLFLLLPIASGAQQLPRFSQYYINEFLINPSLAGFDGRTVINLAARKQWVGFSSNTPGSYMLSMQGRILKSSYSLRAGVSGDNRYRSGNTGRVGLGGIVYHDQNGAIQRTGAQFSYAYHIFIYNSQLSFGLTGNVFQYRIDEDYAQLKYPEIDPLYGLIGKSTIVPDAGIGINYLTGEWHIGVAVAQIFQTRLKIGNAEEYKSSEDIKLKRHYFILADYRFSIPQNNRWEIEPSTVIMFNEMLKVQSDLTVKAYYNRQYWFGLSGRTTGEFIVMLGLKFHNYYFGYSYDYGFNGISSYTYGSHEISLSVKFGDTARRYQWLDRY